MLAKTSAIILAVLLLTACSTVKRNNQDPNVKPSEGYSAPDFTISVFKGPVFHLSALRGKKVILHFNHIGINDIRQQMDDLNEFWNKNQDRCELLAVFPYARDGDLLSFTVKNRIAFPVAADANNTIGRLYGITLSQSLIRNIRQDSLAGQFPRTYLIDEQGVITDIRRRIAKPVYLEDFVNN